MSRLQPPRKWVKIQSVTIASDAITIDSDTTSVIVDTEGAAATDNLVTINGGVDGQVITLRAANGARDVVLVDNTGNLRIPVNFTMDTIEDRYTLEFNGTNWCGVASSNN